HHRLPLRHHVLRRRHGEGLQVQPLRRRARLRRRLPDRGHHLRGDGDGRLHRRLRGPADGAPAPGRDRRRRRRRAAGGGVMPARHLIIGAGTAGLNCIRTIREEEQSASEITLVSAERPYSRMVLPYYLGETIAESHVFTATPASLAAWK